MTVRVSTFAPAVVGLKVTLILQKLSAVSGNTHWLSMTNWAASAPLGVTVNAPEAAPPEFTKVKLTGEPAEPTGALTATVAGGWKARLAGVTTSATMVVV